MLALRMPENFRIGALQKRVVRLFKKIAVTENLGSRNSVLDGESSQLCVILTVYGRFIRIHVQDSGDSHSHHGKQIPPEKGNLKTKTLPFMPPHHISRKRDGLSGGETGIFRGDVRHEKVGIFFDQAADEGKPPHGLVKGAHKHNQTDGKPFPNAQQVQNSSG